MGLSDFISKTKLTHVDENDMAVIQQIARDLTGLDQIKIATVFSKPADQVMVGCLSAIVQQNWIIIRKLSEISQRLAGATVGEKVSSNSRELQNNRKAQLAKKQESNTPEWESRKLCSDENCIGVVGLDGKCTECGR
jgi:hypothetical protein